MYPCGTLGGFRGMLPQGNADFGSFTTCRCNWWNLGLFSHKHNLPCIVPLKLLWRLELIYTSNRTFSISKGNHLPPSLKEILVRQYFYMHSNAGYIVGIGEGWVWIISPFTSCHQCKWMPGECAIHLIWKLQISTSTEMTVPRPSWRWAGMRPAILNKLWPPVTYHG